MVKGEAKEKDVEKKEETKLTDIPGIGPGIAAKLEAAGIYDLMGLAVMSPPALAEMAGVGEAVARKAIQAARGMMNLGFMDGNEFAKKREDVLNITTGSNNLNNLLGGKGIETRSMTEAYGAFGSGKCVSKDTPVCYFNDTRMHVESIEKTYEKYKEKNGEVNVEGGLAVPVSTVKVLAWHNGRLKVVNADNLYKEKVKNLFVVKTKRGRILKITGEHQLLSFENGVNWKKTKLLEKGDLIASPKEIKLITETIYDEDDAYFLGLFTAEGTFNPFSISITEESVRDWVCNYINQKFGYTPTVRTRKIEGRLDCYTILLRNNTRVIMDGLDKCNAENKFIPEGIFLSNEKVVSSFLGGYFDGDAEVSSHDISVTTKSSRLATQLTYLLLRLGISATIKERKAGLKKEKYQVVRISGEDREKLKNINFKLKKFDCSIKNSAHGYPKEIISFIAELYKESIGGNRGKLRKMVGKYNINQGYRNLVGNTSSSVINSNTLLQIEDIFNSQKEVFLNVLKELEKGFNINILKDIYPKLPFAFNSLSEQMGIKKSSIRNYYSRNIPSSKLELLRNLIINELRARIDSIYLALQIISEIKLFNWDSIESVEMIDYDDYVYDFVVPDGHSFIGGNMPTMMHNTQLGLTLAVNVQLPKDQGGADGKAIFIDTEGTFRPERIRQIAEGIGANPEKVLKNILVARAFNSDHQILLLDRINEMIKDGEPIKIVIIDSLTAHFRAEFAGRGQLADRQQKLNKYLHSLIKMAEQHNLAIYVTNQVMANPGMMFGDPTTPIGGNILGHACLTGDSLIQLANGNIIEIKDMKQQKVVSSSFNDLKLKSQNSEDVFVNPNIKEKYNIRTNNQIDCSSLHRFFTIDNFEVVEKEARELKVGDFVAQVAKLNIEGEEREISEFKLKKIGKISKESAKFVVDKLKRDGVSRKEMCSKIGITPRQFRRVLNQEYPTSFDVLENLQNYFSGQQVLQLVPVYTHKHKDLIIPGGLSVELAQIFGYFWGDGNFEKYGLRFRDARIEVLEYYNGLFKKVFNAEGRISKINGKNCYNLSINSREIRDLFEFMFTNIIEEVGKSKAEVVTAFIKGFVDAEGHINKKRAHITIVQKEKDILRYLQMFLLRSGVRSTIKFEIGRKKMNILRIADRDIINYLQIGFTASDKQTRLLEAAQQCKEAYNREMMPIKREEIVELLRSCGLKPFSIIKSRPESYRLISKNELEAAFKELMNCKVKDRQIKQKINFIFTLLNSNIQFEKIREINITQNENELFYDFSVPLTQNYLANGFIVHNSTYRMYFRRGKQGSRVAKLIDSPNLPDNECQFFVTKAGLRDEEGE